MTGHKYYVYVEYFELPRFFVRKPFFWRSNMHSLPVYWRDVRVVTDGVETYLPGVRLAFLPTLKSSRRIKRSFKYKSGNITHPSAVWVWDYKVRVIRNHLYNIHSQLFATEQDEHTAAQAEVVPLALFGGGSRLLNSASLPRDHILTVRNYTNPISRGSKAFNREFRQNFFPKKTLPQGLRAKRLANQLDKK